jgi:hypothetical protein
MLKDERKYVQGEERSGRPVIPEVSDDLVLSVYKQSVKGGNPKFQNFRVNYQTFYVLFSKEIITVTIDYHTFRGR